MSSIDVSRSSHQPAKRYTSVWMQQGRVLLDDDWNEAESITAHERVESLVDLVGPSGTSDTALQVSHVTASDGSVDFRLGAGTMYVGGRRLRWPDGTSYRVQDDFLGPPPVPAPEGDRNDLVWVEVAELPVTATEDAELREVGLGTPDTTARSRLVARVHVETDVPAECEEAWEAAAGAQVDERGVLRTDATLRVGFVPDTTPDDLCTPASSGGYLTHLNQAIRVQLTDPSHFTWGFDNASPVYRVRLIDRRTIEFLATPADAAHRPRAGQIVELLPWAAVLPNGQLQAAESGPLAVVAEAYDPDTGQLTLTADLPAFGEDAYTTRPDRAALESGGTYVYLRVWERGDDAGSQPQVAFVNGGPPVALGATGLEVSISGSALRAEQYWIIAARPAEPLRVVPWELSDGRGPHGPVRLRAPLAVISWADGELAGIHDCRRRFRPLTELQGCCDISVGDGSVSFGDTESIQEAVDLLPPGGGRICVLAGRHDGNVVIRGRRDIVIHGCGDSSVLAAANDPDRDAGPVIDIDDSVRIVVENLAIRAADAEGVRIGSAAACNQVTLRRLRISASPRRPGIRAATPAPFKPMTERIEVLDCDIAVRSLVAPPAEGEVAELWPALFMQGSHVRARDCRIRAAPSKLTGGIGGVQLGGLTTDAEVTGCTIAGGNGHGITLGSVAWVPARRLPDAVRDYQVMTRVMIMRGWLVRFDGGCIVTGDDPVPDDVDEPESELVPVSVGPLADVVIADNEISKMAGDGIGVARFFEPGEGERADIIAIEGLRIDRNLIVQNRRTPPAQGTPAHTRLSGAGGIALADVSDLRVRDNRIFENGRSELVALCGVFVLSGSALLFTGNDLADNGADPQRGTPARIGNRGGIVVRSARSESVGPVRRAEVPEVGAVLMSGNRVSQPAGQAIWVMGTGQMAIHGNQLSAGSLAASDIFSATLRMLEGRTEDLGAVAGLLLTHLAGLSVTVLNLGLPIDTRNPAEGPPTKGVPTGIHQMLTVADQPGSDRAYRDAVRAETGSEEPAARSVRLRATVSDASRLTQGGHVLFADNQVTLDLLDDRGSYGLCSVLLASFDDVAMHDNQIRALTRGDLLLVDAVAVAMWTVRCQGNRLQENAGRGAVRARGGLGTLRSLLSLGLMNTTTANQMSLPYVAESFAGRLVDEHNLSLT